MCMFVQMNCLGLVLCVLCLTNSSLLARDRTNRRGIATMSACLSGTGVHYDRMVNFSADLS